jgi:hypothetical protein
MTRICHRPLSDRGGALGTTGTTTRITDSANASFFPAMSADGRYITFYAFASNQVPDDANGWWDVFVWDATTGTTTRITDGDGNSLDPTISADGRYRRSGRPHRTWCRTTPTDRVCSGGMRPTAQSSASAAVVRPR